MSFSLERIMKKRIFGRMIKKLKWLVIISVALVALGTVGIGIASVYHMKYALKSLFNMESTREMIVGLWRHLIL